MNTSQEISISIVLSNKGYVAVENGQIFQLWKNKCLKDIYEELEFRYPNYNVSLASLETIKYQDIIEVANQLNKEELYVAESIIEKNNVEEQKPNINFNKDLETGMNTMKSRNKAKAKAVAVIGINITAGVLHLGFQTMADSVCYAEAKIIDKMNVFDKTVDEIMNARKAKTKEAQKSLLKSPKRVKHSANKFYCRIKDIKEKATANSNESIKSA